MKSFDVVVGQFKFITVDDLSFARQLGVNAITINRPDFDDPAWAQVLGKGYPYGPADFDRSDRWAYMDLVCLRNLIEGHDLRLAAIENVPYRFIDQILDNGPRRQEQIDAYCDMIRMLGKARIPILGYHWATNKVWRTATAAPVRGGAVSTAFDLADAISAPPTHGRVITADEHWNNYSDFISQVLPVAEEAGVKLALHPDDPPHEMLGGVARVMRDRPGFDRALGLSDSPAHQLCFCVGTWAEMGLDIMYDALDAYSRDKRIAYVHLRNVKGAMPAFSECFIDEGDVDIVRVIDILRRNDFDGFIIDDHVPKMVGDSGWSHRGRAFATGYLKGVMRAMAQLETQS